MAVPGQSALIFPNLCLEDGVTVVASSETLGDADNILTERVDTWWSPADFSIARTLDITWTSAVKFNCVFLPQVYITGASTGLSGSSIQIESPYPTPTETKSGQIFISSGAAGVARNELSQPNKGLDGATQRGKQIAANRFSTYLVFDNAVTESTLRLTFTPVSPSASVLRVPCVIPGWYFGASIAWDGEWAPSVMVNGSIRRSFRFRMQGVHGYDAFSRWHRQILFRGLHQKWGLIFAPSWEELHYDTFLWGYMHDFKINMMRAIDDDVYLYEVSGRIVESLNSEGRPGI